MVVVVGEDTSAADRANLVTELADLGGLDLYCWCPLGMPCHADLLIKWANGGDQ
jgi:hypothetical protein